MLTLHLSDPVFHSHVAGDSITVQGWDSAVGGFRDQMAAAALAVTRPAPVYYPVTTGAYPAINGPSAIAGSGRRIGYQVPNVISQTSWGGNSYTIDHINTDYAFFITQWLPMNLLVIECNINDRISATPQATHLASCRNFLDRFHADAPTTPVLWLGSLFDGEQWLTGPNRFSSGLATTDIWETNVATACAERSGWAEYASQCDWSLAWEVANNTPSPGVDSGLGTLDRIHPLTPLKVLMGTNAMTHIQWSP